VDDSPVVNDDPVLYETHGATALLTLNRPDKLNAINGAMVIALDAALDRAEADDRVRVIVLNGAGRAFSAGFDLDMGEGDASDPEFLRRELTRDFDIIMRFWHSPKPTIAAVHTYCLGSAMEMAVACDITIAAAGCRFGAPEVKFGSGIVALILPWLIGPKLAKELLLTGDDRVSAERAAVMGLVNRVVAPETLLAEALDLARTVASNDQVAVRATKQAINRSLEVAGMHGALAEALEMDVLVEATETAESKAFNEILARDGPKAAIEWRRSRTDDESR
jgi:enoyl-CoA hydratase